MTPYVSPPSVFSGCAGGVGLLKEDGVHKTHEPARKHVTDDVLYENKKEHTLPLDISSVLWDVYVSEIQKDRGF